MPRPQLYQWGARALYIGPALGLSAHRNAVAVLAVGLDHEFALAHDPHRPMQGARRCRAALIPPSTLHCLESAGGVMAFLYVDALSTDLARLRAGVGEWTPHAGFTLTCEARVAGLLSALADGRARFAATRSALEVELLGQEQTIDANVRAAIEHLIRNVASRPSLPQLSAVAGLSESRFRHVFKEATGVSLKRYRVWAAMGIAMRLLARSESLTEAAHEAGFSSSAHFSAAFREMFGMAPSHLVSGGLQRHAFAAGAE